RTLIDVLIVLKGGPTLLERDVKPAQLEANAAAIKIGQILLRIRNWKLIGVGDESGSSGTRAGIMIEGQVRDEPVAGQQVQPEAGKPSAHIKGLLVEGDAARQQR